MTLNRQSEDNLVDEFVCEIISLYAADMDCGSTSHRIFIARAFHGSTFQTAYTYMSLGSSTLQ
jgi:hypothetical protein